MTFQGLGPCDGPTVTTKTFFTTISLPAWVALTSCAASGGGLEATNLDLSSGTWTDGTITIPYRVDECIAPTSVAWNVYLHDNAVESTAFLWDRMEAEFPDAILTCVDPAPGSG